MYNFIINPKNGNKIKINSKKGKQILLNYINYIGGASVASPDSITTSKHITALTDVRKEEEINKMTAYEFWFYNWCLGPTETPIWGRNTFEDIQDRLGYQNPELMSQVMRGGGYESGLADCEFNINDISDNDKNNINQLFNSLKIDEHTKIIIILGNLYHYSLSYIQSLGPDTIKIIITPEHMARPEEEVIIDLPETHFLNQTYFPLAVFKNVKNIWHFFNSTKKGGEKIMKDIKNKLTLKNSIEVCDLLSNIPNDIIIMNFITDFKYPSFKYILDLRLNKKFNTKVIRFKSDSNFELQYNSDEYNFIIYPSPFSRCLQYFDGFLKRYIIPDSKSLTVNFIKYLYRIPDRSDSLSRVWNSNVHWHTDKGDGEDVSEIIDKSINKLADIFEPYILENL